MNNKITHKPMAIAILAILGLPVLALADESQPATAILAMSGIDITATRGEKPNDTGRHVDVVTKEKLDQQQPASIPQTVQNIPNVTLEGGPRDTVQSVNIRGLGGDRVLQLIDGVRQDFDSGHRPSYFLDPSLVKNVEVIKGPVSSLWGSGALGGLVSVNTIDAADVLKTGHDFGGFIKQGYNSNGDYWTTTLTGAARYSKLDALVSTYYRDGDDLKLGNGSKLVGSGHRDKGVMGKFNWFIDDAQTMTFNLRTSDTAGAVPSQAGSNPNGQDNFLLHRDSQDQHASVDYKINPEGNDLINGQALVYWNNTEVDEYRISDNRKDTTQVKTVGLNLNNRSDLGKVSLLYGVDGYQDKLEATRGGINRPVIPEATTKVWGGFTQLTLPLSEQWIANMGARYDSFSTEANNLNTSHDDSAVSPSVALTWKAVDGFDMTVRYDEAFRAPTSQDLYTTGTHFTYGPGQGSNSFVPNPNLKAEKAKNTELLVNYQLANAITQSDRLSFHGSLFHNKVSNFIEEEVNTTFNMSTFQVEGTTTVKNVDEAELNGFEISTDYQLQGFDAMLSYGQTRGTDKKTGDYLSNIPANTWKLDVSQSFLQKQFKVGTRVTYASSQDHKPTSETNEYDNYTVADVYARWTPKQVKNLTVDLSLNNVTDKSYRVAFSQLDMPGRDARISAKYDF